MEPDSDKKINRGLPSGATPLTKEDLDGLLPKYIITRSELNDAEFKNITEAQKKYLLSKKEFKFTYSNLFKVHKEMFGKVWKWAGKKRKTNKNIGVDKYHIELKLKELIDDFEYWNKQKIEVIEISARLHHRLVYIHPFNNGNGRWARFIVNLFLKEQFNSYLDFPENEIILATKIRKIYIQALQEADKLNYDPLINFHRRYISKQLL